MVKNKIENKLVIGGVVIKEENIVFSVCFKDNKLIWIEGDYELIGEFKEIVEMIKRMKIEIIVKGEKFIN